MTEHELLCAVETPRRRQRRLLASLAGSTALASTTLLIAATAAQAGSPVAIPANMLPQGGHFVAGAGSIGTQGLTETITQTSQRGIIDFNSFSIGKSGTVKINNGAGATLDRVTGGNLSQIMGTLSATGSVYLVNPQGVVVGKSGVVTTGGSFVASSLDISNQNFMAGQTLRFTGKGASDGMVKNLGSISSSGGDVFLIARSVVNSGSINAPNGTVGLGAGQEVLLKDTSVAGGRMTVRYGTGNVRNKGAIAAAQAELRAAGGNVYALAGNHTGMIRATGSATRGGHVWLTAGGSVFASGPIVARNHDGSGGHVTIRAAKLAKVTGRIDASATSGTHGKSGGTVIITGHDVTVGANAVIDARGTGAGGTVLIGGDRQGGANAAQNFAKHKIANARTTTVEAGAQILADGGTGGGAGMGGNVVVWSDKHTVFKGAISVTGGQQGGDGGFVETSSHGVLDFTGTANRLAPKGKAGTLLLDPEDLDIVAGAAGASTGTTTTGGTISSNANTSTLTTGDLLAALTGGNVIVQTTNPAGSTGQGNIDVQASFSWANANSLTLSAFNGITVDSGVTITNTGGGSVILRADNTGVGGTPNQPATGFTGQVTFGGTTPQIVLSGGTTPGSVTIFDDRFSNGAFTPHSFAGNVTGGAVTAFQLVNDLTQLQAIQPQAGNYALGTNIDASATATTPFAPIGVAPGLTTSFDGIFDGQGHTISNLDIGGTGNLGLFGLVRGTVQNVTLANVSFTVTGNVGEVQDVGGIAAVNNGTISNVTVGGTITLTNVIGVDVGGVAGQNQSGIPGVNSAKVTNSVSTVAISVGSLSSNIGGLVGENSGGSTITSSRASGAVTVGSNSSNIGGLVGRNQASTISSSTASGAVSVGGGSVSIGGLVGNSTQGGKISSSTVSGAVSSSGIATQVGGLIGQNANTQVTGSSATGSVSVGGSASLVGGLVGLNTSGSTISSSTASGNVSVGSGSTNIGGLAGRNNANISAAYATGAVNAAGSTNVGGLVGINGTPGSIAQAYATGAVIAPGGSSVGGLVGANSGSVATSTFWDIDTSGQTTSAGGTGLHTAQAQSATLFTAPSTGGPVNALGFDPTIWGIVPGESYPYLLSQFATPPQVVTGTAGTVTAGASNAAGESVELVVRGTIVATGSVGANGYYNLLLPSGTIGPSSQILAFLKPSSIGNTITGDVVRLATPSAVQASVNGANVATKAETGLDIATNGSNTVLVTTDSTLSSLLSSVLTKAAGAVTDPGILYSTSGNTITFNAGVDASFMAGAGGISIDNGLVLSALSGNGGALMLSTSNAGNVTQGGTITAASLALTGSGGAFTLSKAGNVVDTLSASLGSGTLSFTNSGAFSLGNIMAGGAKLDETAIATVSQLSGTTVNLGTGTLTLDGISGADYELTNGNTVGSLAASLAGSTLGYTDNTLGGYTLGAITAGTVTLGEDHSGATISQSGVLKVSGTLTLNGDTTSGDTVYNLSNTSNSVGTLTANLGPNVDAGALTYVDNTTGGYTLGNISAATVSLTELASGATVKQALGAGVQAMSLALNGSTDGTASFTLDSGGAGFTNSVATLSANLGTSSGGAGTGTLTYVDNSLNPTPGYTLGAVTAGTVTLGEAHSGATISQSGALSVSGTLTLNGLNDTTYTLNNSANSVGVLVANLGVGGGTLSFTNNGAFSLRNILAGSATLDETAAATVTQLSGGIVLGAGTLNLKGITGTDYELTDGNTVGMLTASLGGGTLSYTDDTTNGSFKLGNITAGTVTLQEDASSATISQAMGASLVATSLTLIGASGGDTTYTLDNGGGAHTNSVGTLIANLGTSTGGVGTGTLAYVDNTPANAAAGTAGGYTLGSITAGTVTLTELASSVTVKQGAGDGVKATSLTLNGSTDGSVSFTLDNGGGANTNTVGTLIANLGTSTGGIGTGTLTYVDNNSSGFTLGAIKADNVVLQETAANATISQTQTGALTATNLSLKAGLASFTLDNAGNAVTGNFNADLGGGNLTFVDTKSFTIAGGTNFGIQASTVALSDTGSVLQGTATTDKIQALNLGLGGSGASFALSNTSNSVNGIFTASLGSGNLSFVDSSGFTITGGIQAGTATLSSGGTVTQGANTADAISVTNLVLLNTSGNYTLGNAGNSIGTLAANAGSLSVTASAITVGSVTDPLSSTTTKGITTQGATALFSDNSITISAPVSAASVQLANATSGTTIAFGGASTPASTLTISSLSNITSDQITIGRDDANASGEITVTSNISLPTTSTLTLESGTGVTEGTNTITVGTLSLQGTGNFQLTGANNAGTINASLGTTGTLSYTSMAGFTVGGISASTVTLESDTDGAMITQGAAAASAITATNLLLEGGLNAHPTFMLTNTANSVTTLAANLNLAGTGRGAGTPSELSFTDNGGFAIGTVSGVSGVTANTVDLSSTGRVTQSAAITSTSLSLAGSNTSDFELTSSGNSAGSLTASLGTSASGGTLNYKDDAVSSLTLGNITAGTVTLTGGRVIETGTIAASSLSLTGIGNSDFELTNTGNSVSQLTASLGSNGTLDFFNSSSLTLGNVTGLNVTFFETTPGTTVSQASNASITTSGILTLEAGTGAGVTYTLTNSGNTVGTLGASLIAGSLSYVDDNTKGYAVGPISAGAVKLDELQANATISGGSITVGTLTLGGTGGNDSYSLTSGSNSVGTLSASLGMGNLSYTDASFNPMLGNITAADVTLSELNSGAFVSQVSGAHISATTLTLKGAGVGAGNGDIFSLTNSGNSVTTVAADLGTGNGSVFAFASNGGYAIGTGTNGIVGLKADTVGLDTAGTVTQSAAITTGTGASTGLLLLGLLGNTGNFQLTDGANNVSTLAAELNRVGAGSAVNFADNGGFTIGTVSAGPSPSGITADSVSLSSTGTVMQAAGADIGTGTGANTGLSLSGAGGNF